MSTSASPRRALRPLLVLSLLSTLACYAQPGEPEPASQPSAGPGADPSSMSAPGEVGAVSLALTVTPADVRCVRATLSTGAGNQVIRTFDVIDPGGTTRGESRFSFNGVPPGKIRVFVEAFNVICSTLSPTTPATWISQDIPEQDFFPGAILQVNIVLRRPTGVEVLGDFRDVNPNIFFNFSEWKAPAAIVGTSVDSAFLGNLFNQSGSTFTPSFTFSGADAASFGVGNCLAGETCCQTGRPIVAGGNCVVRLVFRPNRFGRNQATLEAGSNVFLAVSGSGATLGNVSLTPANGNLGAVAQSTTTVINFTVSNGSTTPFPTSAFVTGASEFQIIGGSCLGLTQLDPGANCIVSVRYTAGALGQRSATLNIGAMSGGLQASLSATTVQAPFAAITPFTRDFGSVLVGQSADLTVTVVNPTAVSVALPHSFSGPNASEFSRLNGVGGTCSTLLQSGGTCIIFLRFSPTSAGSKTATFSLGPEVTQSTLVGVGVSAGSVQISPSTVDFGTISVGQTTTQGITLTNSTPGAFPINVSLSNTVDFSRVGGTCGSTLPAASSCTFVMAFNPTSTGSKTAMLSAGPGSAPATLTGTAINGGSVQISPSTVDFGTISVGQTTTQGISLTNSTQSAFPINLSFSNTVDFSRVGGTCGSTLPGTSSCTLVIAFNPTSAGSKTATLSAGPGSAPATLIATAVSAGSVTVSPGTRNFGNVSVGQSSDAAFTVTNTTPSAFTLGIGLGMNPTLEFSLLAGSCGASLASQQSCTINVRFSPTTAGPKSASLNIGAGVTPASLTGAGVAAASPITNLVVNDHTVGNDNIDNSTQWVVQTNFRATVNPFSDRTGVSITSTGNGTLDGKTWIRTAADSKSFGTGVTPPPTLASFTVTGTFVDLLVDDRHGGGARPSWLDTSFTDAGFNVTINDGSATRPYSVWRKSVTPGSTVNLPAIGSTMAPCYIVVVE